MTLADLQAIGRDVGIAPALVAEAAKSLDAPKSQQSRRLLGLPIGVGRTIELGRRLSPAEWDRLVVDLRETFDARGVVKSEGNFKQWTNGNLQVLVEPTATGDRVRLQTIKGSARSAMVGGFALLGTASVMTLINGVTGASQSLGMILAFALGGLGMLGIPLLQLPGWARERRLQMEGIASRLAESTDAPAPEQS
jgi:hypothetical protein